MTDREVGAAMAALIGVVLLVVAAVVGLFAAHWGLLVPLFVGVLLLFLSSHHREGD